MENLVSNEDTIGKNSQELTIIGVKQSIESAKVEIKNLKSDFDSQKLESKLWKFAHALLYVFFAVILIISYLDKYQVWPKSEPLVKSALQAKSTSQEGKADESSGAPKADAGGSVSEKPCCSGSATQVVVNPPASQDKGEKSDKTEMWGWAKDLLLPILGVLIIYIVSATGLERLKTFDSAFSDLRKEINERLSKFEELLYARVDKELESQTRSVSDKVSQAVKDNFDEYKSELMGIVKIGKGEIEKIRSEFKNYDWIKEANIKPDDNFNTIDNIDVLRQKFEEMHRAKPEHAFILLSKRVNDALERSNNINGTADSFFNFVVSMERLAQPDLGLRIAKIGLQFAPNNLDLLAIGLNQASSIGATQDADNYYRQLRQLGASNPTVDDVETLDTDYKRWTPRVFRNICDYYFDRQDYNSALKCANQLIKQAPLDQGGYSKKLRALRFINSEEALKFAVGVAKQPIRAPQLFLEAADMAVDAGQYEQAIELAGRAIATGAEDQPSVRQAAVLFTRGTGFDGMLSERLLKLVGTNATQAQKTEVKALYRQMVLNYDAALAMGEANLERSLHPSSIRQVQERRRIVRTLMREAGMDLIANEVENDVRGTSQRESLPEAPSGQPNPGGLSIDLQNPERTARNIAALADNLPEFAMQMIANRLNSDDDLSASFKTRLAEELRKIVAEKPGDLAKKLTIIADILDGTS